MRSCAARSEGDDVTGRSIVLTGWANTVTSRATRITAHAVEAAQGE
jgi:hypothetical protein